MPVVFARADCFVVVGSVEVHLIPNAAYDADDPVVVRFPQLFGDTPAMSSTPGWAPVEQATAAPGERRRRG